MNRRQFIRSACALSVCLVIPDSLLAEVPKKFGETSMMFEGGDYSNVVSGDFTIESWFEEEDKKVHYSTLHYDGKIENYRDGKLISAEDDPSPIVATAIRDTDWTHISIIGDPV